MTTHAPAPWCVKHPVDNAPPAVEDATGRYVAPLVCEPAANAQLVSAAPEMLHALELIFANAAESPEWIRARIAPAIAKATGAQQ